MTHYITDIIIHIKNEYLYTCEFYSKIINKPLDLRYFILSMNVSKK
jgi:hypothetical protein